MKRVAFVGCCAAMLMVATPAHARQKDMGVGTDIGVSWSEERAAQVSRDEAFRTVGTTRTPKEAVRFLLKLADAGTGGYWGLCL